MLAEAEWSAKMDKYRKILDFCAKIPAVPQQLIPPPPHGWFHVEKNSTRKPRKLTEAQKWVNTHKNWIFAQKHHPDINK